MKTYESIRPYIDQFLVDWEMFQTNVVQKIKTHFVFNDSPPESRTVCKVMLKDMLQPDRLQMAI